MSVRSRRWLIFLLAGLVAVMTAGGSGLIIASAAHASGSQKGVRAQDPVGGTELQDSARVPEYSYDPAAASTTSLAKVPSEAASGDGTRSGSSAAAMAVVRSLVAAEEPLSEADQAAYDYATEPNKLATSSILSTTSAPSSSNTAAPKPW